MYLKAIFELEEDGIVPLRARIAERLDHSGPTVSQTIARMQRDGLVTLAGDRHLEFTEHGRVTATRVMRKHRLAERLLVDVLGLDWAYVHEEACRWEHVMSEQVEERILAVIEGHELSPYGNPIPGLAELDVPGGTAADAAPEPGGGERLPDLARDGVDRQVRVVRIGEPAQVRPDELDLLRRIGVAPGAVVSIRSVVGQVQVTGAQEVAVLDEELAAHLFATAAD